MSRTIEWAGIEAVAAAVTAIVALYLLGQGQRDRRRLRDQDRRRQASQLLLVGKTARIRSDEHTRSMGDASLSIYNASDGAVTIRGVRLVRPDLWSNLVLRHRFRLDTIQPDVHDPIVLPRQEVDVPLPPGWAADHASGGQFAIVEFADSSGTLWRRRTDTLKLDHAEGLSSGINPFQRLVQRMSRFPPVRWVFVDWPLWLAMRSARRHPDRVPLSLRFTRAAWGYWFVGREDEWLRPQGAPRLWGYIELEEAAGVIPAAASSP